MFRITARSLIQSSKSFPMAAGKQISKKVKASQSIVSPRSAAIKRSSYVDGNLVTLVNLLEEHSSDLWVAGGEADSKVFRYLVHHPRSPKLFQDHICKLAAQSLDDRLAHPIANYTIIDKYTGVPIGLTGYEMDPSVMQIRFLDTWLDQRFWVGVFNLDVHRLLLEEAFESLRVRRVQFDIDARNDRGMAAVSKLGASKEGVLRRNRISNDGEVTDTAIYSIIDEDWRSIKKNLEARMISYLDSVKDGDE